MRRPALALAALLALTACGSGSSGDESAAAASRITVQAAGGEGELAALQEVIDAFEASRPGTTVDFTGIPSQGDHVAKLATGFAGGAPPDVFLLNYRRVGQFAERDVLEPADLGPISRDALYPGPLEAFTINGSLVCLPQNASSSVTYVNPELFERAGLPLPEEDWTWDDLEQTAEALDAAGIPAVGFDAEIRTVAPFVWTAGGEVVDDTAMPTRMVLERPEGREALAYLDRLQDYGVDATSRAAVPPADQFAQGELAMFFDSRRAVPNFRGSEGLSFDVRPLPRHDAATPSRSLLASDAWCVSKDAPALATELAQYAVGPDGGAVLARSGRTVPSLKSLAESPDFLAPDQDPASSRVFLDVLPDLRRLPNVKQEDEAEEFANDLLGQFFARQADLDATVASIGERTAAAYGR